MNGKLMEMSYAALIEVVDATPCSQSVSKKSSKQEGLLFPNWKTCVGMEAVKVETRLMVDGWFKGRWLVALLMVKFRSVLPAGFTWAHDGAFIRSRNKTSHPL
ncbi:hypothetical protein TWF569_007393 [Orbilia oligospora]|nr:hypothetical protein TWF103_003549 [Orbilia oligospora]KAF3143305.1 hypothetical protein TWF569_007393 [Orbilia oligospora]KAF3147998.1 hypothetical protein TWF594_001927 [Orbilia oligospora]